MHDFGDVVDLSINITDVNGAPANAGSVTVTITLPDQSTVTSAPISPTAVGQYDYAYTTVQAGRHVARWTATGANADNYTEVFEVRPMADETFVSLSEVKDYLNISLDKTTWDEEIRGAIVAACQVAIFLCGPVAPVTYTEAHSGGTSSIVLYNRPVISVTSVVEVYGATSLTLTEVAMPDPGQLLTGFTANKTTGEIIRRSQNWEYWFPYGRKNVIVTYVAGRLITPGNVRLGTMELISHLWRMSQLNTDGRRPKIARPEPTQVILGFAVPNRVIELFQATPRIPAIG